MAKEKRTKPCSNCKKSKVKCIYTNNLPCERCIKNGQAVNCQFVPKLPSLKLPQIPPSQTTGSSSIVARDEIKLPPLNPLSQHFPQTNGIAPNAPSNPPPAPFHFPGSSTSQKYVNSTTPISRESPPEELWKNQIEGKMSVFDDKLNDLVDVLRSNQKLLLENQQQFNQLVYTDNQYQHQNRPHNIPPQLYNNQYYRLPPASYHHSPYNNPQQHYDSLPSSTPYSPALYSDPSPYEPRSIPPPTAPKRDLEDQSYSRDEKKIKLSPKSINYQPKVYPQDFRQGFLDISQARTLFKFFDANISPQLFGFEISKFSVDSIWESSPILICAICTIASMHYPDQEIAEKLEQLQRYLHDLCGKLLLKGRPKTEVDGFNTIVALVLCSFWLSNSQIFTGLALQLAKEIGLNKPVTVNGDYDEDNDNDNYSGSKLSDKNRLKLWYLLYVLDGQQSITFNRQRLVNSEDYSLKHSKELLTNNKKFITQKSEKADPEKKQELKAVDKSHDTSNIENENYSKQYFTDLRLVSQVEYNQALNEAFKGNAWDLLAPSSLGIPSKSNLELDKWMVSWTVLLSPVNNGAVWSSKSTLIYYNFAKMHINSHAVRQLQMKTGDDENVVFPKWNSNSPQYLNNPVPPKKKLIALEVNKEEDSDDSEDSDDEDEFVSNKELMTENEAIVNANIAVTAANTVLNLVLNDRDILNNLKYVPVHIHIMLYYAALLLINPPSDNNFGRANNKTLKLQKSVESLKTVKLLQSKIYLNLPTDKSFGDRLISSLDDLIQEKIVNLRNEIDNLENVEDFDLKRDLHNQLDLISELRDSGKVTELKTNSYDSSGRSSPGEKISAWPGSNHGHP